MDIHEQDIERLRAAIELMVSRKMRTPKDFDYLSEQIFERVHQTVSPTTLLFSARFCPKKVICL